MIFPGKTWRRGSALIVTLLTLSALSLMAATAVTRIFPRLPIAYQNAAWEEARLASEAGIDAAMADLVKNATGTAPNTWNGWKEPVNQTHPLKEVISSILSLKLVTGLLGLLLGTGTGTTTLATSDPIYIDNLKVSAPSGIPTEVDVKLWALQSTADSSRIWFRIRSTATCALPPIAYAAPDKLDPSLRRLSLRNVRPSLRKEQMGDTSTITLPNVTRTVEVLVEPVLPFELALWAGNSLSLAPTGAWNVDSYDSSDSAKSALGLYPGRGNPMVQTNGHVASSFLRPSGSPYGPCIDANGARVSGAVATNGGDDPATSVHENVAETIGIDASRIRNDFCRPMSTIDRAMDGSELNPPAPNGYFNAGSSSSPNKYRVAGNLTSLKIKPPLLGSGLLVIYVDGALDLSAPLLLPASVTLVLYVRGDITFRDTVNSGPWNSNRPGQLLIFGDVAAPATQRLDVFGDSTICAAFYGPRCDVTLPGAVNWNGSISARNFSISSGGDGGVHYDESLAKLGPPISFRIVRCVEDVRE